MLDRDSRGAKDVIADRKRAAPANFDTESARRQLGRAGPCWLKRNQLSNRARIRSGSTGRGLCMSIERQDAGFFLILMRPTERWASRTERDRLLHHQWLERCESEGITLLGGRLDRDLDEAHDGGGAHVIRAGSREGAELIAQEEPYAANGLRSNTVHRWSIAEGNISISIRLMTGNFHFE